MMNKGARLNDIIHSVVLRPGTLDKPCAPTYDDPEFMLQNIRRLYGSWYDGYPAYLKPASEHGLTAELASLVAGARALAERAVKLQDTDPRLACHLVELAALADPQDIAVHAIRAEVYQARRAIETSLMARGIYGAAANESRSRSATVSLTGNSKTL
jgi:alkyl sulfatase BDS1-like metallo-beta-lactamase superfamily hydrolase